MRTAPTGSPQVVAMDLVNALPGCSCQRFSLVGNTTLETTVVGWAPSLHRGRHDWAATPARLDREGIEAAFQTHVAVQRRRAGLAARLAGSATEPLEPERLEHLDTDRLLLRLDPGMAETCVRTIGRFLQVSRPARDQVTTVSDLTVAEAGALEGDEADGDPRPRILLNQATDWGEYDGRTLTLHRTAPESLVAAMAGRRVGEIVDFAGRLEDELSGIEDRVVVAAEIDRSGSLRLATRCDWVPMA